MPSPSLHPGKIVVFTGSGIQCAQRHSDLSRGGRTVAQLPDSRGRYARNLDARPEGIFGIYNERRTRAAQAEPNAAHRAIVEFVHRYVVTVITQNVDELHERAGAGQVIHMHGELRKRAVRGTGTSSTTSVTGRSRWVICAQRRWRCRNWLPSG